MRVHALKRFGSVRYDHATPPDVYADLDHEFHFDFDPCPLNPPHALFDGLTCDWGQMNYVNPPYRHATAKWLAKALEERSKGKSSVFLAPSSTDCKWWHEYATKADEIRFIQGRLKFGDAKNPAPFGNAILVFYGNGVL